jgi:hypothetical protein
MREDEGAESSKEAASWKEINEYTLGIDKTVL